jgi:hypothetical protein
LLPPLPNSVSNMLMSDSLLVTACSTNPLS